MKSARLGMRVRPEDKQVWEEAASRAGLSLAAWIELQLNASVNGWHSGQYKKLLAKDGVRIMLLTQEDGV